MQQPRPIRMTQEGFANLQAEKLTLERERPLAVEDLKKAREMGDLSENGYYKAARAKLSSIDARLRHLLHVLRFAKVMQAGSTDVVGIGATVRLQAEQGELIYSIVGEHEANPSERKISHLSPLGKALMDRRAGDEITITTPNGQKTHKILSITVL